MFNKPILSMLKLFKSKTFIVFALLCIIFYSCSKENIHKDKDILNIEDIKNDFYRQNPTAHDKNFLNSNFTTYIQWNSLVSKNDSIVYIKIGSNDTIIYKDDFQTLNFEDYFWLKVKWSNNKWNYSFISFIPDSKITSETFKGKIITTYLPSKRVEIKSFKNNNSGNNLIAGWAPIKEDCVYGYVAGVLNSVYCSTSGTGSYDEWLSGSPGDYNNTNPNGGGGSGGNTAPTAEESPKEAYILESSSDAIVLENKLKCFDAVPNNTNTMYKIKLCADLANDNNPKALIGEDNVGHSFITLTKTNGSISVTESFGFYPQKGYKSVFGTAVSSQIVDDGATNHEYNASLTVKVTKLQFQQIIDKAVNKSKSDYNLKDYNCTDYAIEVFNAGMDQNNKIIVDDWIIFSGYYGVGQQPTHDYGTTPSGLYKSINNLKNSGKTGASTTTENASHSTNCN